MSRDRSIENMPPTRTGRRLDVPRDLSAVADSISLSPEAEPDADNVAADFAALLYPNRSLPNAGFMAVMTIVIVVNLTLGLYFYSLGAWPVLGFCGLDIFFVWLAFKISYRQGRLHERVELRDGTLLVSRVLPSGHESRWSLQAFWTRVHIDNPASHESRVRLVNRGRTLILGSFLSPKERTAFGEKLKAELERVQIAPFDARSEGASRGGA